jgi:hypothetical protein
MWYPIRIPCRTQYAQNTIRLPAALPARLSRWNPGLRQSLSGGGTSFLESSTGSSLSFAPFFVKKYAPLSLMGCPAAAQQGSESLLAPLCGAAVLRVTAGSAVRRSRAPSHGWLRRSRAPSHGWLRCAAQQGSESRLAPLCGAAGLRVTAGSAVRRSRAPSHCWLRCAAHGTTRPAAATPDAAPQHAVRRRAVRRVGLPLTDDNGSPADAPGL